MERCKEANILCTWQAIALLRNFLSFCLTCICCCAFNSRCRCNWKWLLVSNEKDFTKNLKKLTYTLLESWIHWSARGKSQADCKTRAPIWPSSTTPDEIMLSGGQCSSTDVLCLINKWARCLGNTHFNVRNRLHPVLPQANRWLNEQLTSLFANISHSFLALGP